MNKFTIDRSRWYRGKGADQSRLVKKDDKKCCCLGLIGLQLGVKEEAMTDVGCPFYVDDENEREKFPNWLRTNKYSEGTGDTGEIMRWNDSTGVSEELREERLTELFKQHDIELEFVNE